jgi:thiamine biosynthesis lipoprotein
MLHTHRFRAMNTDVAAWLWSASPLAGVRLAEVERFFGQVEAALSRFRPQSELSRLNAAAGRGPQPVSSLLLEVLALALDAARSSGGLFDPTLLHALRAAGYDRSFEQIGLGDAGPLLEAKAQSGSGWSQVLLDAAEGTVALPAGLGIDLGGIAKGWAVDAAAGQLGRWGAALVDAGGDIRSAGAPGQPWPVAVQDPCDETRDLAVIGLADNAVATSSSGRRRWQRGGQSMHHLIDPRTGRPSRSDLHTVTVLAPTAVAAEVAAKVALLLGREAGQAYLASRGLAAWLIDYHGCPVTIGQQQRFKQGETQ